MNIEDHGVKIKKNMLPPGLMADIITEIEASDESVPKHGIRNAEKKFPSIAKAANNEAILTEAERILASKPQLVRVIFFDKTPEKNWHVIWHQDKTIALNKKIDLKGWGPWTIKDKTHHVQPPLDVLNNMVTFRLHLDPADKRNGCLKVIPSSHKLGIISQSSVEEIAAKEEPLLCKVEKGDAVIMRPHILHASSKSENPSHRRVVHIEYSSYELPKGLEWAS